MLPNSGPCLGDLAKFWRQKIAPKAQNIAPRQKKLHKKKTKGPFKLAKVDLSNSEEKYSKSQLKFKISDFCKTL
jgi:hypothetical protein